VEALALVHDIGHPPFGHAGERALDSVMRKHGLFFDHNLHALRIVEDFELRYAAFRGLNLTFEVREGIIKHSRDYSVAEFPELAEYLLDQQPPLEAQLIDVTDELAYNTADLDDGYEAHLLTLEHIIEDVPLFARLFGEIELAYPDAPKKLKFNEVLRRMLDRWIGDLIESTRLEVEKLGSASEGARATIDDIRRCPHRLAGLSREIEAERRQTKDFLHRNLYFSPALEPEKEAAERIVGDLFELWMTHPEKLPRNYQEKAGTEPLARVVCDYVAGMTDTYIYEQYEKQCG
jgi:dGTPase